MGEKKNEKEINKCRFSSPLFKSCEIIDELFMWSHRIWFYFYFYCIKCIKFTFRLDWKTKKSNDGSVLYAEPTKYFFWIKKYKAGSTCIQMMDSFFGKLYLLLFQNQRRLFLPLCPSDILPFLAMYFAFKCSISFCDSCFIAYVA